MAMSYTTLTGAITATGSIKRWVNNPTIDADEVLADAEAEIYSRLRVREMRTSATLTTAQGDLYVALPTGFLDPISLKDRFFEDLILEDMDGLIGRRVNDEDGVLEQSEPGYYAIWDERIQFNCAMDDTRSFSLLYYKTPTALGASNTTNFLTNRYPYLLRAACIKHASMFLKDAEEEQKSAARMEQFLAQIATNDDLTYRGSSPPERG